MERPNLPSSFFVMRCPTKSEIRRSIHRKQNGAVPGLNGLPYLPFKQSAALQTFIHQLAQKVWKTRNVPTDWAEAFIALLSKSQNLASVSEFRPIAVTSTIGKIFFSVTSERLQSFMTSNDYISRTVQKGFLTGVAGCIEHTFTLMEALKEANAQTRHIVITWIDLANAYGSVRHNLIQFALNWFHVPLPIQELIFNYYEKLCAMIKT